jgi:quercetin dioxygenase-like cupin family protein
MNIKSLHTEDKPLQTTNMFTAAEGKVISIQIAASGVLKDHSTAVPALLICITGESVFENEQGITATLQPGDFVNIEPHIKHRVTAIENSNLLLVK